MMELPQRLWKLHLNPSNSLTVEVTIQITSPDKHCISALPQEGKVFRHFHYTWNSKNTDFAIGGFLVGLHRSPLILCLFFQDTRIASRSLTPEIFSLLISLCSSYTNSLFPSLYFSTLNQTKMRKIKVFSFLSFFHPLTIFYSSTFSPL